MSDNLRSFSSYLTLFFTIQGHNPERPYVCHVCLKGFKRKEHLNLHAVIHSGLKTEVRSLFLSPSRFFHLSSFPDMFRMWQRFLQKRPPPKTHKISSNEAGEGGSGTCESSRNRSTSRNHNKAGKAFARQLTTSN